MYPVSQEFIDKIKADERQVFAKLQVDYTSPFLDQSISVEANETANASFPSQTADSVAEPFAKIASLDGSWVLDGTYALAPTPQEAETKQMGWWGKQLAGAGGVFVTPYPTLTVSFFPRPITRLQAVGDSKRQEWPVDFAIRLYDGNNTLLHTETVTGNTQIAWSKVLDEPVTQVEKMELEITKWSHEGRQAKILEFFTSIQETYEGDDILLIHLLEEREVSQGSLPVGNISANEIDIRLNNETRKFDAGNKQSPLYQLLKANRRIKAWLGVEVDDMIVSGSISPYADPNSIRPYIDALRLNTVNVPIKIIVPDVSSSLMSIDKVSKEAAIEVVQYLKSQGMKVILEPYPWIAGGTVPETEWQPSDINLWFWNWKTAILQPLIEEIANPYGVEYLNVASNYVNMEYATGYWQDTFAFVRSLYSGKIIYRTNWWVTAVWAPETIQAYYNKLYNPLFGDPNLDIISIACYFELTDTPVPSVDELLQCLRSTTKYNRQQNIYQEIKNFYEVWGKPIFFGELGFASYERCASEPWNVSPSSTYSEEAQSNCFQAYMEMLLEEPWFTGFSVYCIGDTISPYSVLNKAAEIVIRSWRRTKKEWAPLGTFWSGDWSVPEDDVYAQTTGRDRLELLRKSTYSTSQVQQNKTLYDLAVAVLEDAGLKPEEYWVDPELQQYTIPYAYFDPQSHREALRKIAEACLGQVYCDRNGIIRIEGPSFLQSQTEPVATITQDDYFRKDNPVKWSEIANYVEVETQPLRPDIAQEVYRSNEPIPITAGQTKTITAYYNHTPCIEATATLENAVSGAQITKTTYYAWGANITVSSSNMGTYELVINAKPLKVLNKEKAIAKDEESILDNGMLKYTFPANPLVQTREVAQTIADTLLAYFKNPRRDVEIEWRGNPALLLGDRTSVVDKDETNEYFVTRQELEFDGALRARMSGRKA